MADGERSDPGLLGPDVHLELARAWESYRVDPRSALASADRMLEHLQGSDRPVPSAPLILDEVRLLKGVACKTAGHFRQARELLEYHPALQVGPWDGHRLAGLNALAYSELMSGAPQQAMQRAAVALGEAQRSEDEEAEAEARLTLGCGHHLLGDLAESLVVLSRSKELFRETGDDWGVARACIALGNTHFGLEELGEASASFLESLEISTRLGLRVGRALALSSLGLIHAALDQHESATECYRAGLAEFEAVGMRQQQAVCCFNLAEQLLLAGKAAEARSWAERAHGTAVVLGATDTRRVTLGLMAQIDVAGGNFLAAGGNLESALSPESGRPAPYVEASLLRTVALIRRRVPPPVAAEPTWRRLPASVEALDRAIALARANRFRLIERRALGQLAEELEEVGNYRGALAALKELRTLTESLAAERAKRHVLQLETRTRIERIEQQVDDERRRNRQLNEALEAAERERCRAEDESRQKGDLLQILGHDIRNPLTAIRIVADSISLKEDPETRRAGEQISGAVTRTERLIRSLLNGFAADAGKLTVRAIFDQPFHLVRTVCEEQQTLARDRSIIVSCEGPEDLAAYFDPELTGVVLQNLIENAIKFSPRGRTVRVVLAPAGAFARLQVIDQGIGFAPADRHALFREYGRGAQSGLGSDRSFGLGLYFAKRIVEAQGGTVDAFSAGPGRGSTFTVDLPLEPPPPAGGERPRHTAESPSTA